MTAAPLRVVALALALSASLPALAAEQTQQLTLSGGALVPDTAAPPFHLDFLLNDPARTSLLSPGGSDNVEIALSSPNSGVFHFLFSPRPQFGLGFDRATGTNRGYAGLTWNLFDSGGVYGNFGLLGSYETNSAAPYNPFRPLESPLMLHGALELGYHFGDQHSLSLQLDQGRAPEFRVNGESSDNFRLRYGLKF
jgi:hypothetical protein